jgi:glycosyltransferase involved in cell wall biosynthesis/SAM-dependent methyltransferase
MGSDLPSRESNVKLDQQFPIVPMAHGDLHRLALPHVLRHLATAESSDRRLRVLDLGAGTGSMSQLLHSAGYDVEACDLEPGQFQYSGVTCRKADLTERLPYEDASFDGIVCVEVLEHVDGHERLFREVARVLRPGGVFLFTTPNVMSIKSRLSFLWTGFEHSFYPLEVGVQTPQEWHISGYGGNRYRFVLGQAGMELREVACDKLSRTSLAFAWLAPLIKLRTWLRHRAAPGAALNNSLAALFGRTMIGVAMKPSELYATAREGCAELARESSTACPSLPGGHLAASSAEPPSSANWCIASSGTQHIPQSVDRNPQSASPLTVIIPCKNEREHIRACIQSAWTIADEVLVADSGSTDGTLEIARELGCRIVEREYRTSGDFKNWAIPQAAREWVLILDSDERITPALAAEIRRELVAPRHDGYWIYRRNHFLGHPIRFGPWKNDRCLRLFHRELGRYVGPTDHAEVELSRGTTGELRGRMTHYTCSSYGQYLAKLVRYADVQSRVWQAAGRRTHLGHLLLRFPLRFLQGYFWRLGFLDGLAGLQVCFLIAYLSFLKHAYLWQLQHGRDWRELEGQASSDRKRSERPAA